MTDYHYLGKRDAMSQKNKNNFIVQGSILAAASVIVRIMGLLYRAPLTRIIGDQGMGYYSFAYNIYAIILVISSYSIPVAVSKLIATRLAKKEFKNVQRIFKASLLYVTVVGGLASILMFVFANQLVTASQTGAVPAIRMLAPAIFLSGYLGVLRGYFQGYNTMMPTSMSQIGEGFINAVISVVAAYFLVRQYAMASENNAIYGAMGSTIGTVAGVGIALIFVVFVYICFRPMIYRNMRRDKHPHTESYSTLYKALFITVTPILLSSIIFSINTIIDQNIFAIVLERQHVDSAKITSLFGIFSNKFMTLINVPVGIAASISNALLPSVASAYAVGNTKETVRKIDLAMRFTLLIAVPCMIGLAVLASPIMILLFGDASSLPAKLLIYGCINVLFWSISTLTNGILQGLGKVRTPVKNAVIALIIHIISCVVLLLVGLGIYALVISTALFAILMCILNAIAIAKTIGYNKIFGSGLVRILMASAIMGVATYLSYKGIFLLLHSNAIATIVALCIAGGSYFCMLFKVQILDENNINSLPGGRKIASIAYHLHLIS